MFFVCKAQFPLHIFAFAFLILVIGLKEVYFILSTISFICTFAALYKASAPIAIRIFSAQLKHLYFLA